MNLIELIAENKSILFSLIILNSLIKLYDATMVNISSELFVIPLLECHHNDMLF